MKAKNFGEKKQYFCQKPKQPAYKALWRAAQAQPRQFCAFSGATGRTWPCTWDMRAILDQISTMDLVHDDIIAPSCILGM